MNSSVRKSLIILAALLYSITAPSGMLSAQVKVKVALDSAYLEMGRTTPLHVEVTGKIDETGGILLPDTLWREVEVASLGEPLVTDLGNGNKELRQEIILQAFDSGLYTLPPVLFVQDGQVTESNRPALKVMPVAIDSLATIHDYYDAQNPPRHFFDFLPDWMTDFGIWILLALLVIGAALYIYFKWIKQGRIPLVPAKKPIPPYELAMQRLETLRSENLCEKGQEKEYYTRLTDILRNYLDTRFGINAMEMTSSQILNSLRHNEATRLPEKYMSRVLEIADFVKFAKARPLPEDNAASFRAAMQFVEDTRPLPEPDTAPAGADGSIQTENKSNENSK